METQEAMMDAEMIDELIQAAWKALLNHGLVVRLYRKKDNASIPFDESTQEEYMVDDHLVVWAKFMSDGLYMLARLPKSDKLQITDEFELGGERYKICAIAESFTINNQLCHEVVAKRKDGIRNVG